ncbi:hypothetical protein [Blastococcus haudaquaticus]|uniref:hypothetical protein n=1 Tax=Blastococcus haudaquaticus TaxID=1938745 RepID=UPI001F2557C1|nr:hypothetical protein [Blastococcus haudaquaticus]
MGSYDSTIADANRPENAGVREDGYVVAEGRLQAFLPAPAVIAESDPLVQTQVLACAYSVADNYAGTVNDAQARPDPGSDPQLGARDA